MMEPTRSRSRRVAVLMAGVSRAALVLCLALVAEGRGRPGTGGEAAVGQGQLPLGPGDICRAPVSARDGLIRLAAAVRTDVSPMGRQAPLSPAAFADTEPPLWDGLGTLSYPVTTANAEAQKFFDQGLRLAYAFNHAEAQRAFRKAQKLDRGCAMCFWGEALVLGPNINMPMEAEAVAPAFAALSQARALADRASPRERALIAALAKRYSDDPKADRPALDKAYAAAMGEVAAQYPDDNDIAVLYAEASMNLSPWDYWQPGGREPNPQSVNIVPTLERVLARNPGHPGAIHYYIHAVEASDRPQRAEAHADRLGGAMPGAGHLVHMPSHIYYRIGRYRDAFEVNNKAVAIDEKYLAESNAPIGVYRLGYYPHNIHFVLASAQMSGDGATVIAAAEKLGEVIPNEAAREIPLVQPVKAAPYFAHALFGSPQAVLALPDPGDAIPLVKAMWHYARGVAAVRHGDFDAARREANAIETLDRTADFSALAAVNIPSHEVLRIAANVVHGRIAQAQGNYAAAIQLFETAAAVQDKLPYMEPPYWYYPVRQSLGAVLLQAGRVNEAEQQFQLSLKHAPNNAWSYFGLLELYKARGDAAALKQTEESLARTWTGDRQLLRLSNL